MTDRRVFDRFNLVDVSVAVVVLLLIPMGYAAFLLFRTPRPTITSVEPAAVTRIEERAAGGTLVAGKLKVRGTALRPVLRAALDNQPAIAFIFESPASADVLYGELPPGAHDLVLYDGVQEVARAAGAVKIAAKPPVSLARVRVVGSLIDLDEAAARAMRVGLKFPAEGPDAAEIVALGEPAPDVRNMRAAAASSVVTATDRWRRPAALLVRCDPTVIDECRVGDDPINIGVMNVPGAPGQMKMRVEEVVPSRDPIPADARVRFLSYPDLLDLVKVGDLDESAPVLDGRAATVVTIGSRQLVTGESFTESTADGQQRSGLRASDRLAMFDADLRLGLDASPSGLLYRGRPIKVGGSLTFSTGRYVMRGTVLALKPRGSAATAKP